MTDEHLLTLLNMKSQLANKILHHEVQLELMRSRLAAILAVLEEYNV